MLEKTEAVILRSVPYKDTSKIVTALTQDLGLISFIVSNISIKNPEKMQAASCFSLCELVLKKNATDLFFLNDSTTLNDHYYLRKDLSFLRSASEMVNLVLSLQFPQRKSPFIFLLLKNYLTHIALNPNGILVSFVLKFLRCEGFLHLREICNVCEKASLHLSHGESLCKEHAPEMSIPFSEEEFQILQVLAYTKSFNLITNLEVTAELKQKIICLYKEFL